MSMFNTEDRFKATDKLNKTFTYEFVCINPSDSSREVVLYNIDLSEYTYVEMEWFRQRKIEVAA